MEQLLRNKITDIVDGVRQKKYSAREICQFYLSRIERLNPKLNAVLTVSESVLEKAKQIDDNLDEYKKLPLLGVPILLKDIFCTKGIRTTAASKMLENFVPPYSAEVVNRLEEAGALILGKCNQDEFAMGNSNENSAFGPSFNPWNREHVPGGSSGGCAVATSLRFCAATLGTDTGGSVRQPSSFCHLVGMKPTYGRVSRYGMIAYASSLDQAGPMTLCVEDSARILEVISGRDEKDSTSVLQKVPSWSEKLNTDVKSLKIAWLNKKDCEKFCSPNVMKILKQTVDLFQKAGALIEEVSLPLMEMMIPVYYLVSTSEASSNLARYSGIPYGYRSHLASQLSANIEDFYSQNRGEGFGSEVKRRILMGTYCLSQGYYDEYYNKACQIRRQMRDQLIKIFSKVSILIAPVCASPAWKIGENSAGSLNSYTSDSFTVLSNLTGVPSISVPAGFSSQQLPIGVQLIGNHFDEQSLFNAALFIQKELNIHERMPNA